MFSLATASAADPDGTVFPVVLDLAFRQSAVYANILLFENFRHSQIMTNTLSTDCQQLF
jgi:hypothetical protein